MAAADHHVDFVLVPASVGWLQGWRGRFPRSAGLAAIEGLLSIDRSE